MEIPKDSDSSTMLLYVTDIRVDGTLPYVVGGLFEVRVPGHEDVTGVLHRAVATLFKNNQGYMCLSLKVSRI